MPPEHFGAPNVDFVINARFSAVWDDVREIVRLEAQLRRKLAGARAIAAQNGVLDVYAPRIDGVEADVALFLKLHFIEQRRVER